MTERRFQLEGYDTFEGEPYPLRRGDEGDGFTTERDAIVGALEELKRLEEEQPSSTSGGQAHEGIQDQVYVVRPDGTKYRVFSAEQLSSE